ncbi:endonuclease Q family protein [Methanogenium sp. S4BF]|uniref:endonuclease Q family protein n=1 Tax=Methanogenium sp. S4BF TaxID=1789226 RepID=UPI0024173A4F|nr:endonuclease Q family protein [Methanogenium sp. S4BF]WFN34802.1 endonuclease Q family protein [Methanogenium sp. S4BF]
MAVSKAMSPERLLEAGRIKGIEILGTGDALHPGWRSLWADYMDNDEGILIVPTMEVEAQGKVHHLIMADTLDAAAAIADAFSPFSNNITTSGRPYVSLSGEQILDIVHECGGIVGPAHAFTPWTGMYGRFDSLKGCYGSGIPDFLELGLSADSSYGAGIAELDGLPFLSNSDAHSPSPLKVGREFTRIRIHTKTSKSVIQHICAGDISLNAGFFPEEGKYNRTACTRCYTHFSFDGAKRLSWCCPCNGGRIKMGVRDRALLHAGEGFSVRPPYVHMVPLGEIIRTVMGASSPLTRKCQALYTKLTEVSGSEISVLMDIPLPDISAVNDKVARVISDIRDGVVILHPGGGGKYGTLAFPTLCNESEL